MQWNSGILSCVLAFKYFFRVIVSLVRWVIYKNYTKFGMLKHWLSE